MLGTTPTCNGRYGIYKTLRNYAPATQDDTGSFSVTHFEGQKLKVLNISGKTWSFASQVPSLQFDLSRTETSHVATNMMKG